MMDLSDEFEASSEYSYVTNTASIDAADTNDEALIWLMMKVVMMFNLNNL